MYRTVSDRSPCANRTAPGRCRMMFFEMPAESRKAWASNSTGAVAPCFFRGMNPNHMTRAAGCASKAISVARDSANRKGNLDAVCQPTATSQHDICDVRIHGELVDRVLSQFDAFEQRLRGARPPGVVHFVEGEDRPLAHPGHERFEGH